MLSKHCFPVVRRSRAVTRPNRHTTSHTNEGCAIWDRFGSRISEESSHPRICSARNAADITLPPHERPCAAPAHTRGDKQTAFDHTTTISPRLTVRAIRPMRSAFITCSASRTVGICTHASPCELYPATVFLHGAGMPGESKSLSRTLCVCHRTHRQKVRPRLPPTFGARPHASHADAHRRGS